MEKLIAKMYLATKEKSIPFIILDIPQFDQKSSIPESMLDHLKNNSDTLFYYKDLLLEYNKLPNTHLPHGHRHISKESHKLLGEKIAQYIIPEIKTH